MERTPWAPSTSSTLSRGIGDGPTADGDTRSSTSPMYTFDMFILPFSTLLAVCLPHLPRRAASHFIHTHGGRRCAPLPWWHLLPGWRIRRCVRQVGRRGPRAERAEEALPQKSLHLSHHGVRVVKCRRAAATLCAAPTNATKAVQPTAKGAPRQLLGLLRTQNMPLLLVQHRVRPRAVPVQPLDPLALHLAVFSCGALGLLHLAEVAVRVVRVRRRGGGRA